MASQRFRQILVAVIPIVVLASPCQNARPKTTCYEHVMDAMLHGFARNPKDYVGLSIKSTFTDFQGYFHNVGMHGCSRPCLAQEQPCVKFGPQYSGMPDVNWAKQVGIVKHPEWYPELPYPASDWQIAHVLYTHGVKTCPRPCEHDEEEGHFVPVAEAPVYADSEGWLTSTTVTVTETTLTDTRTGTRTFTSRTETTATVTSTRVSTATMTTITIPPLVTIAPPVQHTTNKVKQPASQFSAKPSSQGSTSTVTEPPGTAASQLASTEHPSQPPSPTAASTATQLASTEQTTQPPSPSATTTPEVPAQQSSCIESGKSWTPLDAAGYTAVPKDTTEECQAHCKSAKSDADDIGHFLYYEPLRTCHCPPLAASEVAVGPEFVSGPLSCNILLDDSSVQIPKTPFVAFSVLVMFVGAFAATAALGAAVIALRRRALACARSRDAGALLDEESGGPAFLRTWPDTDSAVE
eukprot:TRINITY_DN996_c0_g1_i1.p1 TRINITY_DN996_c0_g1~~TRINITY_DN996_c0_g1_i1.p1  ORF type:complete len:494 (+),score=68.89 TRINITY_DN996_c0_g1_i1:85-1482(+)